MEGSIADFWIDGKSYETQTGKILIVNTMDVHSIRVNPDYENPNRGLTVTFPYDVVKRYYPEIDSYRFQLNDELAFSKEQSQAYARLQAKLSDLAESYAEQASLKNTICLLEILDLLLDYFLEERNEALNSSPKAMDRMQVLKTFIDDHYQADIGLVDLAQLSYLSKEYLARFFKEHMGMTVGQYLNAVRAKHAREAILSSKGTFTEIALDCGFSGQRTMDRALLKNYGLTARELKDVNERPKKVKE